MGLILLELRHLSNSGGSLQSYTLVRLRSLVIKYPSKPSEELLAVKDPDTEVVYGCAPDAFVHFVEQTYEAELVAVQNAREAWKG